ncbi:uncharacterized protein LOC113337516 [Papaver somniferum]|uniref:uncharacterized protein LOC113337516 n=1 Tax=Papaver somniferum TaxID=3469 RepID=UPI000E70229B|nr:uncharacterized protein LOC113337516 [Papaver somniferum]
MFSASILLQILDCAIYSNWWQIHCAFYLVTLYLNVNSNSECGEPLSFISITGTCHALMSSVFRAYAICVGCSLVVMNECLCTRNGIDLAVELNLSMSMWLELDEVASGAQLGSYALHGLDSTRRFKSAIQVDSSLLGHRKGFLDFLTLPHKRVCKLLFTGGTFLV